MGWWIGTVERGWRLRFRYFALSFYFRGSEWNCNLISPRGGKKKRRRNRISGSFVEAALCGTCKMTFRNFKCEYFSPFVTKAARIGVMGRGENDFDRWMWERDERVRRDGKTSLTAISSRWWWPEKEKEKKSLTRQQKNKRKVKTRGSKQTEWFRNECLAVRMEKFPSLISFIFPCVRQQQRVSWSNLQSCAYRDRFRLSGPFVHMSWSESAVKN